MPCTQEWIVPSVSLTEYPSWPGLPTPGRHPSQTQVQTSPLLHPAVCAAISHEPAPPHRSLSGLSPVTRGDRHPWPDNNPITHSHKSSFHPGYKHRLWIMTRAPGVQMLAPAIMPEMPMMSPRSHLRPRLRWLRCPTLAPAPAAVTLVLRIS